MLSDEVIFKIERRPQKEEVLEIALGLSIVPGFIAGTVGGYLALRHGLEFSKFWSIIVGGTFGGGVGALAFGGLAQTFEDFRTRRIERKEQKLDNLAIENGSPSAEFNYCGNSLECVIRPEYEDGKLFYFSASDRPDSNFIFSYHPNKKESLRFSFEMPQVSKKIIDAHNRAALTAKFLTGYEVPITEHPEEKKASRLSSIVEKYCNSLSNKENLKIKFEKTDEIINAYLTYSGENFKTRLGMFAKCASEVVEASRFYIK